MRGIGIDIVEIERFETRLEKPAFLKLVFTDAERKNCASKGRRAECFAARFAAKEAIVKATNKKYLFNDIIINNHENGAPTTNIPGIKITISHEKENAIAFAIWEEDEQQ